jgi:hypothetical protein
MPESRKPVRPREAGNRPPRTWSIEPWIAKPAKTVVYEYGVRLDGPSEALAARQIELARELRRRLALCVQGIHGEMNAWVLRQAGSRAIQLQSDLDALHARIGQAQAHSDDDALRELIPQRNELSSRLLAILRRTRDAHGDTLRNRFFARIGRHSATETYQLRSQAVADGLGWATANQVLDGVLLAYQRSMATGRAPRVEDTAQRDQDSLHLQFTAKGGLPVDSLRCGKSQEIHLEWPATTGRRAYAAFRFRMGLARDGLDARGTWQVHRELPRSARVASARLVRRRLADRHRWSLQLVLNLDEPICRSHDEKGPVAAVHFGWMQGTDGRRVATIARGPDADDVEIVELPSSIDEDLNRSAVHQSKRAQRRLDAVPGLLAKLEAIDGLPEGLQSSIRDLQQRAPEHIAASRVYRLREQLEAANLRWIALDDWIAWDRRQWQAAVGLARRARGRRRDFYRVLALRLATRHRAIVVEPINLRAASQTRDQSTGEWNVFSRHARAGRLVAALNELEQAIRWACARHRTPVFELRGPTASTCSACGASPEPAAATTARVFRCSTCGFELDRAANAALCAWRMAQQGMDGRVRGYATLMESADAMTRRQRETRHAAVVEHRRRGRDEGAT